MLDSFNKELHCLKCYQFIERDQTNDHPYTVIFGIEDFELRVYDGSHLKIAAHKEKKPTEHDRFSSEHQGTCHTVKVNQGCFIVFDSGLVHSGTPYEEGSSTCYRIHFYAMPKSYVQSVAPMKTSKSVTLCNKKICQTCVNIEKDTLLKNVLYNGEFFVSLYLLLCFPLF